MKRISILLIAIFLGSVMTAQANSLLSKRGNNTYQDDESEYYDASKADKVIKGFCGGMMVHSGYQFGGDNPYGFEPNGATFGLGGVAKLQFTKHFRTGFEGYFSSVGLRDKVLRGSHNKIFWAGALVDWFWKAGRFYPYIGVSVGGGTETSLYMFDGNKHDWKAEDEIIYRKHPFGYVDPFVGCDFAVGKAIRLTVKADWILAVNNEGLNRPLGPRFYLGVIFAR